MCLPCRAPTSTRLIAPGGSKALEERRAELLGAGWMDLPPTRMPSASLRLCQHLAVLPRRGLCLFPTLLLAQSPFGQGAGVGRGKFVALQLGSG